LGTLILPLILLILGGPVFGWAKPVPFNPQNFHSHVNIRRGSMWVALAGPGSNLILAFIASFVLVILRKFIPLPAAAYMFFSAFVGINLFLALLNLVPIPPLDGSKILWGFLPPKYDPYFMMLERYGFFIIVILLGSGALSHIVLPPFKFLYALFLSIGLEEGLALGKVLGGAGLLLLLAFCHHLLTEIGHNLLYLFLSKCRRLAGQGITEPPQERSNLNINALVFEILAQ